ncbi:START domain-containing protein 10-like isoform X1 [Cygnus olor]|uniref:START domain-containing protein 10-like isoform X1 n=1 Tax=Cygnus olor TaxID=8869 RepID=UPI001ADE7C6E|nr:START domain-containing protein 10-like isoform X1 [Cygnus olor]
MRAGAMFSIPPVGWPGTHVTRGTALQARLHWEERVCSTGRASAQVDTKKLRSETDGERMDIAKVGQTRISCKDVPAETLYDVLHDTGYRKKWDSHVIETYDIGRLTANADVGYYSWKCPSPLKNRDFVTLRSWLPLGDDYIILNYSVKHPKFPPRKDFVRAVSLQTGYLIKANGTGACVLYYLTQVDPRGSLPKWVVNRVSQFVAPKAMKKIYKAGLKYPEWKRRHDPGYKPWVYPEQSTLPSLSLAELSLQHADSLEHIDETGLTEDHLSTSDHEA